MVNELLLKNVNIIDEQGDVTEDVDILIGDGRIQKIGRKIGESASETMELSGHYVTPGFVNLHTHSPMNIFRGLAEDVNIDDWFNEKIWPYESRLTGDEAYLGSLLSICEMIDCGVTAFADHYMFADRIYEAVLGSGIRADIAPTVFGVSADFEEELRKASDLIEEKNGANPRIKLRMGPHAPYTCPPHTLKKIVDAAKKLKVGIHIHVSETKSQVEKSLTEVGRTPFEALYDAGGFDVPVIVAHGLWIEKDDLKYLNEKTFIAVCPKTYMKLGMGFGGIWGEFENLPLAVGTDGAASSNTQSPLEQARLFALAGKFLGDRPEAFRLREIWGILMNGHKALGFNTGKVEEGYDADLLIWDLNRINTLPLYNPLASIIYSSGPENIVHSMVCGRFVKKDGRVLMDTDYIVKNVQKHAANILKKGRGESKIRY